MTAGITRRQVLAQLTATAAMLAIGGRRAFADPAVLPEEIDVYIPFGGGSPVATAVGMLRSGLALHLDRTVEVVLPNLPDRMPKALAGVDDGSDDRLPLLATDLLAQAMWDISQAGTASPTLDRLTPIATLTAAFSTTLFVGAKSSIRTWADFAAAAQAGSLTIVSSDPGSIYRRFLERATGADLVDVLEGSRERGFAAVTEGRAVAGLIGSPSFAAFTAGKPGAFRPIVTFGGKRHPLINVPTLKESTGNRRYATTSTVALFGPEKLDPTLALAVHAGLVAAAGDASLKASAASTGFPIVIGSADDIRVTIGRDRRALAAAGLRARS